MKKFFLIFVFAIIFLPSALLAEDLKPVTLTIFYGQGCPHCEKELSFLEQLQKDYSNLTIRKLEVWYDLKNASILSGVSGPLSIKNYGVPVTIVGQETIVGYFNDEITGKRLKNLVTKCSIQTCSDFVGDFIADKDQQEIVRQKEKEAAVPQIINVPSIGEVDVKNMPLPVLTALIGTLDGFNPCAMWILLFLISLLIGTGNRKKMFILGLTFIITGSVSYFVFMAAWLNFFLLVGYIPIIRAGIGIFAIVSGTYYIWKWYQAKKTCEAINDQKRYKIMQQLENIASQDTYILAILGIIVLSLAINMIELVCSAGLPAIYTQILSLSKLPVLQYYGYLMLYVFFFSLLQLAVFIVAMLTLQTFAISNKIARWMNLIGGLIILALGFLLIFRPDLIMFG